MNTKLKILFLASWYPSRTNSTAGIFVKHHAEAAARFCDVSVLHVCMDANLKNKVYELDYLEENGVKTLRVYYKKHFRMPLISKIVSFYRYIKYGIMGLRFLNKKLGKFDLLHVNVTLNAGILALIWGKLKSIPFIITEHYTRYLLDRFNAEKFNGIEIFLSRIIIRNARAVTTVSNALKDSMLERGFLGKYYVVPNVIKFYDSCAKAARVNNKKKIIHISLLCDRQKNVSGLLETLHKIKNHTLGDDFELHIIGDGRDRGMLEKIAQKFGLYDKSVFFHGLKPHHEVIRLLQEADFLITNSNYETFSVVTAEAIACGVPVIATKCGGPEDFVTKACGVLIEPKSSAQLEDAIIYMLDNCQKYNKDLLREYIKNTFGMDAVGKSFNDIYNAALIKHI